ncbi:hypothetical protein L1987_32704 [Smallanthus sonchifolius]|uniref:Uncharacterized protein n=1 Tax=Smallanthus sonchifolius TaxID=185202 RepID=A0ACB9HPA6_9ASTR|nr:hypothetical protein L1987_32704 [Smallanthus sonchifolius]
MGHTWNLYNEGRSMDLIDATLAESCHPSEVLRSIEVGLLCVQQNAGDRPNMSSDPIVQFKFIKDDPSSNMNLLPKWFGPSSLNFFENSLLADEDEHGGADLVHCTTRRGSHHCSPIKV